METRAPNGTLTESGWSIYSTKTSLPSVAFFPYPIAIDSIFLPLGITSSSSNWAFSNSFFCATYSLFDAISSFLSLASFYAERSFFGERRSGFHTSQLHLLEDWVMD